MSPSKLVLLVDEKNVIRGFRPTSEESPSSEGNPSNLTMVVIPWQELPDHETPEGNTQLIFEEGKVAFRSLEDIATEKLANEGIRATRRILDLEPKVRALGRALERDPGSLSLKAAKDTLSAELAPLLGEDKRPPEDIRRARYKEEADPFMLAATGYALEIELETDPEKRAVLETKRQKARDDYRKAKAAIRKEITG